jgi:hypothetical protein
VYRLDESVKKIFTQVAGHAPQHGRWLLYMYFNNN